MKRRLRLMFRILSALSCSLAARLALRLFITPMARPIGAEEGSFLATARTESLPTPHGLVATYEWPASGPTVLVVHGWISHSGRLRHAISALHAHGYRILAIDLPGHGRSGGRYADLHSVRDTLALVSSALGPVSAVLAHSYGALAVSVWLAEHSPPEVRAAVLVGMPRDVGYILESFTIAMGLRPKVVERLRALFHERYGAWPEFYEAGALAAQIKLPVLLVHGEHDEFVPAAHAPPVQRRLQRGELSIRPNLKHSAPLGDAASLELIASFLKQHLSVSES